MSDLKGVTEKLKSFAGAWPAYAALGSAALYFLGYLTLRFQLSTLGVATDLAALDERYFFAGARFVVYVIATVPILALFGIPLFLLYLLFRRRRPAVPAKSAGALLFGAILLAVLSIQFVMRQSFLFMDNLLLATRLAGPEWLHPILLGENPALESFFFCGLLAAVGISAYALFAARRREIRYPAAEALLLFLLSVQFLFIPVNYGILSAGNSFPKLSGTESGSVWLVWEGKEQITFFSETPRRALITVPRSEFKRLEITGYEAVLQRLFREKKP